MPEKKITLLYSDILGNKKKIPKEFLDKTGCWIYFGKDYRNLKRVESFLGSNYKLIEISRELDGISGSLRRDYNNYINIINKMNKDSLEWWFTPLSSRNIYMSEIFQNICYLQLFKNMYEKHGENILFVVVESYSTGRIIEEWSKANGIAIKSLSKPYNGKMRTLYSAFFSISKTVTKTVFNYTFAKISGIYAGKNTKNDIPWMVGKTALIDVFVYESNFGGDGSFNDRYFPKLESYFKSRDYNVIYYPTFAETKLNKYALYRKMRENNRFFIIAEDYLHISDYFRSLILSVKAVTFSGEIPFFRDYDITFADRCENKWKCFDGIFKSILVYHLFLRLGDVIGEDIERIICWHENQLQDKALSLAVHESFRDTKIVGVHSYVHYSNYLSIYPIDSEAEAQLVPDVILTTGALESRKIREFLSIVPCNEVAALRYSHLFDNDGVEYLYNMNILVLLPYDRNDAFEILIRTGEILKDLKGVSNVFVRCHPDYDKEIFFNILDSYEWFKKFSFTDVKIDILLHSITVVISTASSSAVEAAVLGVPTILLAKSSALSLNPFYNLKNYPFISVCYGRDELKVAINMYISLSEQERGEFHIMGKELKNLFFGSLNERIFENFICS